MSINITTVQYYTHNAIPLLVISIFSAPPFDERGRRAHHHSTV